MNADKWIRDTAERIMSTFVAGLLVWLPTAPVFGATWWDGLFVASIPPIIVVLMSAVPGLTYRGTIWWKDAGVRVLRSVVQAGGAVLIADSARVIEADAWKAAGVAAAYGALAALKSWWAGRRPDTLTPASLAGA